MSLAYKLFGKPRTVDEFVDLVKKRGESKIEIKLEKRKLEKNYGKMISVLEYTCSPILQAGRYRIKLNRFCDSTVLGYDPIDANTKEENVDKLALKYAEEIAETLKNQGLNVKNIEFLERD